MSDKHKAIDQRPRQQGSQGGNTTSENVKKAQEITSQIKNKEK